MTLLDILCVEPILDFCVLKFEKHRLARSWQTYLCKGPGSKHSDFVGRTVSVQFRASLVKNLLAMHETPVRFLGWEDLLEKG